MQKHRSKRKKDLKLSLGRLLKDAGFQSYAEYLESAHWKAFRRQTYRKRRVCESCWAKKHLNVHHCSYRRLLAEKPTDVIVLCETCHNTVHAALNDRYPFLSLPAKAERTREIIETSKGYTPHRKKTHRKPKPRGIDYSRLPVVKGLSKKQKRNKRIRKMLQRDKKRIAVKSYKNTALYGLKQNPEEQRPQGLTHLICGRRETPPANAS